MDPVAIVPITPGWRQFKHLAPILNFNGDIILIPSTRAQLKEMIMIGRLPSTLCNLGINSYFVVPLSLHKSCFYPRPVSNVRQLELFRVLQTMLVGNTRSRPHRPICNQCQDPQLRSTSPTLPKLSTKGSASGTQATLILLHGAI